jgi:hypothetical protein
MGFLNVGKQSKNNNIACNLRAKCNHILDRPILNCKTKPICNCPLLSVINSREIHCKCDMIIRIAFAMKLDRQHR